MAKAIILMGVSGSGKTTVGQALSAATGWPFFDGDDFHPLENVEKMSRGIPLTDEDRTIWLDKLSLLLGEKQQLGEDLILACSALKEKYRQKLQTSIEQIDFVYLSGTYEVIWERMKSRHDHYMGPAMLESQLEILEPPEEGLEIDIDQPVSEIIPIIIEYSIK